MYFVVLWDKWCSIVPKSWVDENKREIKWPPKTENATTACKKAINPKSNWKHIEYSKLLGPYKTYDTARQIEIAAVELSSDEASIRNIGKETAVSSKRQRKPPARYQKASDDESSDIEIDDNDSSEEEVPVKKFKYQSTENNFNDLQDIQSIDKEKDKQNSENNTNLELYIHDADIIIDEGNENDNINHENTEEINNYNVQTNLTFDNGDKQEHQNLNPQIHSELPDATAEQLVLPACQNCCVACRSKIDQMNRKLDTILMHIASQNSTQMSSTSLLSALPEFTIKDDETLKNFNDSLLHNGEARAQYVKLVQLREKPEGKKHVRDVLAYILDNKYSCKLSWSGQKNTISVKEMAFVKFLTSTVINCNSKNTITEINDAIKNWLQHASDRVKYANEKHAMNNAR